ncbi:DoxX family membrane protein [Streptomyces sp. ST2-7A]|uniref:DoxX family membrane protein n=1 Tax=Streptomyces sp. ST2-7A TaxID=2907214 RepID=UPI001F19C5C2|nr:DoxX family membrane protein [Streptomyces sp. ST2-7A]MCE7081020.1 DoxX family membrane protein [Streptomyces sp. ST2-7A]
MTTSPSRRTAPPPGGFHLPGALSSLLHRHSITLLRVSVALLFLWFGALKLVPNASAAEEMASRTMSVLTAGHVAPEVSLRALGSMEILIGAGLLTGLLLRLTLAVFLVHMAGTLVALVVLAGEMWQGTVLVPTLAGQYVLKNLVLITAGLAIATHRPTVRGRRSRPPRGRAADTGAGVGEAVASEPPPTPASTVIT